MQAASCEAGAVCSTPLTAPRLACARVGRGREPVERAAKALAAALARGAQPLDFHIVQIPGRRVAGVQPVQIECLPIGGGVQPPDLRQVLLVSIGMLVSILVAILVSKSSMTRHQCISCLAAARL